MTLPTLEVLKRCPVCHSEHIEFWTKASDLLMQASKQEFEYSECRDCRSVFMSKRPIEADVAFYYSDNYHPYQAKTNIENAKKTNNGSLLRIFLWPLRLLKRYSTHIFSRLFKHPANIIIKKYYLHLSTKMTYLDFGCGAGKSLDMMRSAGYQKTIGVDFSPVAIKTVFQRGHEAYLVNDFWSKCQDENIGLVRMNHVVEHLYHPHVILKNIAEKLTEGGILHIAVPNPNGISAAIFRENWHGLDCPRHVILYPVESLKKILIECGFEQFEVKQEAITKDFVRSLGYWLASYNMFELKSVNDLMSKRWLSVIFWLPVKIFSLLGLGDRYHMVCHKKPQNS